VQAFVSVVVGGANVIAGTTPAAAALAVIQTALTASYGQLFGQIGLLLTVIVVIRLMPQGLGNLFSRAR
jgi:branched-chain amino acid transport system permease protein